jgi:hypothetical protein
MPKLTAVQVRKARQKDKPCKLSGGHRLFSTSLSDEVIRALGVARSPFYLWKQEHKTFAEAVQEGACFKSLGSVYYDE